MYNTRTTGGEATSLAWTLITGKPSVFPPSSHTHPSTDITDFTSASNTVINSRFLYTTDSTAALSVTVPNLSYIMIGSQGNVWYNNTGGSTTFNSSTFSQVSGGGTDPNIDGGAPGEIFPASSNLDGGVP